MVEDENKDCHEVATPGGPQTVTIVNESGLYTALIRSNNPKAKPFRKWVTSEVLPAIRKTGSTSPASNTAPPTAAGIFPNCLQIAYSVPDKKKPR